MLVLQSTREKRGPAGRLGMMHSIGYDTRAQGNAC